MTENKIKIILKDFKEDLKKNKRLEWLLIGIILILISVVVLYLKIVRPEKNKSNENIVNEENGLSFANYNLEKTAVKPSLPNYSISINELTNLPNFEGKLKKNFSETQKKALEQDNFFVIKNTDKFWQDELEGYSNRSDDWTALYDTKISGENNPCYRNPEDAVFVSSDFLLHVYHRLLEKEFEYIEDTKFYPMISEMTDKMFDKALENYKNQTDEVNKESYQRDIAFLAIPKAILDSVKGEADFSLEDKKLDSDKNILTKLDELKSKIPETSYTSALAELKLILAAKEMNSSPIFGEYLKKADIAEMQDYTQFTPRSHYTKNSILRSYFRVMMWYGRNNFALVSPELTRDAVNLTLILKDSDQMKNWENIYTPTAFLVGKSDDLGINEYQEVLNKLNSSEVNSDLIAKLQTEMGSYQGPKVMSSLMLGEGVFTKTKEELQNQTKGFRLMGQRFTPDAFIFSNLTQGDELPDKETNQKLPSSTTALMVMSIFGNRKANELSQDWIKTNAPDSNMVLNKNISLLKTQFDKLPETTWTQNIYWGWLYTLKALNQNNKTGYPNFVKNDSWEKKNLQTSLGSWTELKHDTLLYAKQSYAEMGAGGDECEVKPVVKGYVEPNIEFLDRLLALIKMTNDGLSNRGLISDDVIWRNNKLMEEVKFYKDIAVKELQNEIISDDDFETLRNSPGELEPILSNISQDEMKEKDSRSSLIADVHTDGVKGEILYEADGIPNYIFVAVKDKNGTRLTRGLVYDYYEFTNPMGKRLSDEDWQKINYTDNKSKLPEQPNWVKSLYK